MGIEKNITSIRTEVIGSMKSFILSSTVLTVSWEKAENDDNVKTKNKKNLLSFFIKSVYDFALKIADHFQLDKSLMMPVKTHSANRDESRPLISGFDLQRAKSLFGYHPKTIEEGLRFLAI